MERDLLLYYQIPLIEVLDGEHSPRKILNLISRLPDDSHTRGAEVWGEKWEGWSLDKHLSALQLDQQIHARHDFMQANSERKLKPFKGLDLPGSKPSQKKNPLHRMLAEAKAYEQAQARANGENQKG